MIYVKLINSLVPYQYTGSTLSFLLVQVESLVESIECVHINFKSGKTFRVAKSDWLEATEGML